MDTEHPDRTTNVEQNRRDRQRPSNGLAPERQAVRVALTAYSHALHLAHEVGRPIILSVGRSALTGSFVATHIRKSLASMDRVLHSQLALGQDLDNSAQILSEIDHFKRALPAPPSALRRTLTIVAILIVIQFVARVPFIPVMRSAGQEQGSLSSLTEAIDLDPAHIARATDQLLHASVTTVCVLIAAVALSTYLVLRPSLVAVARALVILGLNSNARKPVFRRTLAHRAAPLAASEKESRALLALGATAPPPLAYDLAVKAALALAGIALGVGWMAAFRHGFQYSSFDDVLSAGAVSTSSFEKTKPRELLLIGCLFAELGTLRVSYLLGAYRTRLARHARSRVADQRFADQISYRPILLTSAMAVLFSTVVVGGAVWLAAQEDTPDLRLAAKAIDQRALNARQLLINVSCGRAPCYVHSAALTGIDSVTHEQLASEPFPRPRHRSFQYDLNLPLEFNQGTDVANPLVKHRRSLRFALPKGAVRALRTAARTPGIKATVTLELQVSNASTAQERKGWLSITIKRALRD